MKTKRLHKTMAVNQYTVSVRVHKQYNLHKNVILTNTDEAGITSYLTLYCFVCSRGQCIFSAFLFHSILIGYWLDMEIYVRVLVRTSRNIKYAPERVHIFPYPTNNLFITYALLSQKA